MSTRGVNGCTCLTCAAVRAAHAALSPWENALSIRRTSLLGEFMSNRKGDSPRATEQSCLRCGSLILGETCGFCSHLITGRQENIKNGTPGGQVETTSPSTSARRCLPSGAAERKKIPLYTGLVKYFPDALAAVAAVSYAGNAQHSPGKPLHWDRNKSMDQEDTLLRHLFEAGTFDSDGHRHSAKVAWRALAMLQLELEKASAER